MEKHEGEHVGHGDLMEWRQGSVRETEEERES